MVDVHADHKVHDFFYGGYTREGVQTGGVLHELYSRNLNVPDPAYLKHSVFGQLPASDLVDKKGNAQLVLPSKDYAESVKTIFDAFGIKSQIEVQKSLFSRTGIGETFHTIKIPMSELDDPQVIARTEKAISLAKKFDDVVLAIAQTTGIPYDADRSVRFRTDLHDTQKEKETDYAFRRHPETGHKDIRLNLGKRSEDIHISAALPYSLPREQVNEKLMDKLQEKLREVNGDQKLYVGYEDNRLTIGTNPMKREVTMDESKDLAAKSKNGDGKRTLSLDEQRTQPKSQGLQ